MCLLIVGHKAMPEASLVRMAEEQNPHGGGIAWREGGRVRFHKGIDSNDILRIMDKIKPPVIVHFRISTAGGVCPELTHPFPVTAQVGLELEGKTNAVIAHNGSLINWQQLVVNHLSPANKLPAGVWSDTRAMAWLAHIHGPDIFEFLGEKVAYMSGTELKVYMLNKWVNHKQKDGSEVLTSYDAMEMDRMYWQAQQEFVASNGKKYPVFHGRDEIERSESLRVVRNRNDDKMEKEHRKNMPLIELQNEIMTALNEDNYIEEFMEEEDL